MANKLKIKKVAELDAKLKNSNAIILAEYRGLSVSEISELRKSILTNSTFEVTKNTLLKISAQNSGLSDEFISHLVGSTAVAFVSGDAYATIKELKKFNKNNDNLKLKYGIVDGKDTDSDMLSELAKLENKDVLFSKIAMMLKMSASNVVSLNNSFGSKLIMIVKGYKEKLEKNPLSSNNEKNTDTINNGENNKSSDNVENKLLEEPDKDKSDKVLEEPDKDKSDKDKLEKPDKSTDLGENK